VKTKSRKKGKWFKKNKSMNQIKPFKSNMLRSRRSKLGSFSNQNISKGLLSSRFGCNTMRKRERIPNISKISERSKKPNNISKISGMDKLKTSNVRLNCSNEKSIGKKKYLWDAEDENESG